MKQIQNIKTLSAILLIGICLLSCTATSKVSKIQADCKSFSEHNGRTLTNVCEVDSGLQMNLNKQGKRMLQIYLIRHAKPDLKKKCFYSADQAKQFIVDYNSVAVVPFDLSLVKVDLNENHNIYCSNLPRSQETALRIFGDRFPVVSDSIFREFEIRVIDANSFLKLPLGVWQAFSRGSWLLGLNHRGIESRKEAKFRASQAAKNLIKVAEIEETAILVAHGMLNGAIEKELKKIGWQVIQKQGHVNLGATVLTKIVEQ